MNDVTIFANAVAAGIACAAALATHARWMFGLALTNTILALNNRP